MNTEKLKEMLQRTGKRAPSYTMMLNHALAIDNPLIVETGCARLAENFDGDGMSTLIFDELLKVKGSGTFLSVDLSEESVNFARNNTTHAQVHQMDSVKYLHGLNQELREEGKFIDVLYLDSFDFDMNNPHPSSLHHILELTAIMPSLRKGTMICVDDNFENGLGKGGYVQQYMQQIGVERIHRGYQWVWIL